MCFYPNGWHRGSVGGDCINYSFMCLCVEMLLSTFEYMLVHKQTVKKAGGTKRLALSGCEPPPFSYGTDDSTSRPLHELD